MSLKDRLSQTPEQATQNETAYAPMFQPEECRTEVSQLKEQIHLLLNEKIIATPSWVNCSEEEQKEFIYKFVEDKLENNFKFIHFDSLEKEQLIIEIIQETISYGPLAPLLEDSSVTSIFVNGAHKIYIEQDGMLSKSPISFKDNIHLKNTIQRLVSKAGKRIDENSPIVDVRLPDGNRINVIFPPLAIESLYLSIKKCKEDAGSLDGLLKWNAITNEMAEFLSMIVKLRANIVIAGETNSGKTTLLNSLAAKIPLDERIITIENASELSLKHENIVKLETCQTNFEGNAEITTSDLVINAMKMRPDRIVVGECVAAETLEVLGAMSTICGGSLTTIYASSPLNALSRLETMVLLSGINLPGKNIKSQIAAAVNFIIQTSRLLDGTIKVTSIAEVVGQKEDAISMQEIFKFEQMDCKNGKVEGWHVSTGIVPQFIEKCMQEGCDVDLAIFDKDYNHTYINQKSTNIKKRFNRDAQIKKRLVSANTLAQRLRK